MVAVSTMCVITGQVSCVVILGVLCVGASGWAGMWWEPHHVGTWHAVRRVHAALIFHVRSRWRCSRARGHCVGGKALAIGGGTQVHDVGGVWLLGERVSICGLSECTHLIMWMVPCRCWQEEGGHIERALGC